MDACYEQGFPKACLARAPAAAARCRHKRAFRVNDLVEDTGLCPLQVGRRGPSSSTIPVYPVFRQKSPELSLRRNAE